MNHPYTNNRASRYTAAIGTATVILGASDRDAELAWLLDGKHSADELIGQQIEATTRSGKTIAGTVASINFAGRVELTDCEVV